MTLTPLSPMFDADATKLNDSTSNKYVSARSAAICNCKSFQDRVVHNYRKRRYSVQRDGLFPIICEDWTSHTAP